MRKLIVISGIPIDDLNVEETLDRLEEFVEIGRATGKNHQIATVNADFIVKAMSDPELRFLLQESDLLMPDGMPLVWGSRLLGLPMEERVAGSDIVPMLAERAAQKGYSLYLLGAAPGIAQQAADILREKFPTLVIAGVNSPPYSSVLEMNAQVVQDIRQAKPDILLVAFGNPKQEKWIGMYRHQVNVPVMIGVGATLDFIAGYVSRAPQWMQKNGLEWLFRLAQEPRRLWRRYVLDLFSFGYFFVRQWWMMRSGKQPELILPKSKFYGCGSGNGRHRSPGSHYHSKPRRFVPHRARSAGRGVVAGHQPGKCDLFGQYGRWFPGRPYQRCPEQTG
jgi:N-acetylglucosaminyldiphosphoundecaprenol N-acetyl-beta-D-mannosaminyltransferase